MKIGTLPIATKKSIDSSALPIMMQFVIISPTYGPSSSLMGGKYALRNLSTQITNVAMITM